MIIRRIYGETWLCTNDFMNWRLCTPEIIGGFATTGTIRVTVQPRNASRHFAIVGTVHAAVQFSKRQPPSSL